jgi:hypothetical protein
MLWVPAYQGGDVAMDDSAEPTTWADGVLVQALSVDRKTRRAAIRAKVMGMGNGAVVEGAKKSMPLLFAAPAPAVQKTL